MREALAPAMDEKDSFDLFEVFKFKRPAGIPKRSTKKYFTRYSCGRERLSGRRFCTLCVKELSRIHMSNPTA